MTLETSKPVVQTVGTYDLLEKIAEGGMGGVFKGRHRQTGQIVAIKIMTQHMATNPVLLKRFEQEFRAASRLDHPNIVRAIDYGDDGRTPYLVMEFVDGESLGQKLEREGAMSEADAIRLIAQVAQGLHRAHKQGLIHRDVKPDNILVTPDGQAKLADLGLVKEVETDLNLTRTGRGLGTPHFMAPEQFRDAKNVNIRCDIYSLGATLYMMVTNELPFRSNGPLDAWMKKVGNELIPPKQLVPHISDRVDWAIRRAMSAEPDKRPVSCREFVEDLTGRSTRRVPAAGDQQQASDQWYLAYKDDTGKTHTVRGSTTAIRRSLKDGHLGDASNVVAGRSKAGPFGPLNGHPEFRDLALEPGARPANRVPSPPSPPANTPTTNGKAGPRRAGDSAKPDSQQVPHINLDAGPDSPSLVKEWLLWVVLLLLGLASAGIAFYFLQ